jgi:ERCC4-type nuclease
MISIRIDARECELIKKMQYLITNIPSFKEVKLSTESLPLGDIIISDDKEDLLIIERKTINDLSASIKDGRYEEQSYRLNGLEIHNHNIIYLIEGNIGNQSPHFFKDRVDKLTIYSAIFSVLYYKGFSILRSTDLDETATILCNMVSKMIRMKDKKSFYSFKNELNHELMNEQDKNQHDNDNDNETKAYCKVIKKVKKENITEENIGEIMLCQIPGISSQSAIAILNKFNTIGNLLKNIHEDPKCLNDICTLDKNNKPRKISKSSIANILKFIK